MPSSSNSSRTALWGFYRRKERWGLSWKGWLAGFFLIVLAGTTYVFRIAPFLAVTDRVDARTLVVEGWIHDFAIHKSVDEFKNGAYQRIFTTGGPVKGAGGYINDFNTSASVAAERLVAAGVESKLVQMVPSRVLARDRTYSSALALRDWLRRNQVTVDHINLITEGIHARRSRLLFQKAFGDEVSIGIISIPDQDYDLNQWWRYSEGVQEIFRESLAYLYAKFLFHPEPPESDQAKQQPKRSAAAFRATDISGMATRASPTNSVVGPALVAVPRSANSKAGGGARSPLNTLGRKGAQLPLAAGLAGFRTEDHSASDRPFPIGSVKT